MITAPHLITVRGFFTSLSICATFNAWAERGCSAGRQAGGTIISVPTRDIIHLSAAVLRRRQPTIRTRAKHVLFLHPHLDEGKIRFVAKGTLFASEIWALRKGGCKCFMFTHVQWTAYMSAAQTKGRIGNTCRNELKWMVSARPTNKMAMSGIDHLPLSLSYIWGPFLDVHESSYAHIVLLFVRKEQLYFFPNLDDLYEIKPLNPAQRWDMPSVLLYRMKWGVLHGARRGFCVLSWEAISAPRPPHPILSHERDFHRRRVVGGCAKLKDDIVQRSAKVFFLGCVARPMTPEASHAT